MKPQAPIMSQAEADEVYSFLVTTTVSILKINPDEAGKRVTALLATGIPWEDPNSKETQMRIDMFLAIPSERHGETLPFLLQSKSYQAAFWETIESRELVENYDRLTKSSLYARLDSANGEDIMQDIDMQTGKMMGDLGKFEKFFAEAIWSRFEHHQAVKQN